MKKILCALLAAIIVLSVAGCGNSAGSGANNAPAAAGGSSSSGSGGGGGSLEVSFWSAPNQQQFDFWSAKADGFNATNTEVNGKAIQIKVQQMPETPSSEAGIQNAIVTGTVPAASENINVGFAAVLAESEAVYPLQSEAWFQDILKNRAIDDSMMEGWGIGGNQYVLPLFINPMSYQWNVKALKALGFDAPPKTMDEFKAVIQAFVDNKDGIMKEMGVSHTFNRPSLIRADQWWDRWFDFQMQYQSLSGGKSWVEGNKLVLDEEGAKKTFEFFGMLGNTISTGEIASMWMQEKIPVLFSVSAPWEVNQMQEAGKVYGEDFTYGPTIVEKAGDTAYSFADSKGVVLYKNAAITDDMHQGVIEFLKWVYGNDSATKSDLDFWDTTKMMPVRGDLSSNDTFSAIFNELPALKGIAEYIPYAVPCMSHEKMTDIQTALTEAGLAPYILDAVKTAPFNAPDATPFVSAAMDAMRNAGGLE